MLSVHFASWGAQTNESEYSGGGPLHPRGLIGEALYLFVPSFMDLFIVILSCDPLRANSFSLILESDQGDIVHLQMTGP